MLVNKSLQNIDLDQILLELCWRIPSGIPDMNRDLDQKILFTILTEHNISEDIAGMILAEISQTEKKQVGSVVSSFLKKMAVSKIIGDVDMQYPPRQTTIAKIKGNYLVKSIVEFNGVSNQEREPVYERIIEFCTRQNVKAIRKHDREMNSSSGYVDIQISSNIRLFISVKGMKKAISGETFDTDIKEGFVSICYQLKQDEPLTKDTYVAFFEKVLNHKKFMGESSSTIEKIRNFIVQNKDNKKIVNIINQFISQARPLIEGYPNWIIDRNEIFSKIRSIVGSAARVPADKWCPADVYLINPSKVNELKAAFRLATIADNPSECIQIMNNLFINEWGSKDRSIVGVSLKMKQAQGGKAKDFLKKLSPSSQEYNLSKEELQYHRQQLIDQIQQYREKIADVLDQSEVTIHYDPDKKPDTQKNEFLLIKLASLKLFYFLLNQPQVGTPDQLIVSAIGFGLSLSGINPTFFKVVAQTGGQPAIPQAHLAGEVVTIFPTGEDKRTADITMLDKNTNSGISADLTIEKGDQICDVRLTARSNGLKQVTLEIEKIKCRNQN